MLKSQNMGTGTGVKAARRRPLGQTGINGGVVSTGWKNLQPMLTALPLLPLSAHILPARFTERMASIPHGIQLSLSSVKDTHNTLCNELRPRLINGSLSKETVAHYQHTSPQEAVRISLIHYLCVILFILICWVRLSSYRTIIFNLSSSDFWLHAEGSIQDTVLIGTTFPVTETE